MTVEKLIGEIEALAGVLDNEREYIKLSLGTRHAFYFLKDDNNHLILYSNIFSNYELDSQVTKMLIGDYIKTITDDEISLSLVSRQEFLRSRKEEIGRGLSHWLNDEVDNNAKNILNSLKKDCGRLVYIERGDNRQQTELLINAVSTDENYYYLFIDCNLEVKFMTCSGIYQLPEEPQEALEKIKGTPLHSVLIKAHNWMPLAELTYIKLKSAVGIPFMSYRIKEVDINDVDLEHNLAELYGENWYSKDSYSIHRERILERYHHEKKLRNT